MNFHISIMTVISQLEASSSRQAHIPNSPRITSWDNKFANPLHGQPLVAVEGARGTFTLESGITRVSTNIYSNLNVEYMESRVLMGKLMPWYLKGQIFHMEMWNVHFRDIDFISNLKVWLRIPRVPVQYRDTEILEIITQHVGNFIRADKTTMSGLNGMFVRVLLEMDLRLPLKRILVVNDDEECPLLLSYKKPFEICFYHGRKRFERHSCPVDYDNDGCLLVDRIFVDEPLICPTDFPVSEETKNELKDKVMLFFPQPTLARGDNTQEHHMEDEGHILNSEVYEIVRSIGALKAPRPDGIHASLYQNCWEIVGPLVVNLVKDFFNNGSSLSLINHTNIAIIPKVENPELVSNFRPISLCNVTYNTKILSKKGRRGAMAIKLDLEKVYDFLSWDYIKGFRGVCQRFQGAISALASLHGHLLIAQGPKITLNKWNGTELNGVVFFDVPPLTNPGSNKTNRYALLFGTLDGSIGCVTPLDELTFRRLQSPQKKLVDAVAHVAGFNPRAFRQFRSNGNAHRPGPDTIVDYELLTQ
ncbi:Cleavage and polyadenylation specificity factor subunit 1 [Pyrus ussuriensis x Pyrus communis]|uniref:Cleavage and polyadenylation specificity factor subunit 1 n=1 Tax=Pyrus ussuriensis x Pyrus communis TaxID=2448454 RepID=A0A5N5F5Y1_9ROSA|nr:Cleavage and polyadenylation specificity factor subunit 1 [Pyrus ussuriensis x Pyrus communis]